MNLGWEGVIGQKWARNALERAVASGRVAHAYLFHGPDGSGKRAAAFAFAQMLQCPEPEAPCGACPQCRKVASLGHPDVHVMMPEPRETAIADVRARIRRLAEDPYAVVDFARRPDLNDPDRGSNKLVQYSAKTVRDTLQREMSFRPVEGRYKVAILTDAERLRKESANAFLKLLEEPTPNTVFILTASHPDRLLPTIQSRCQLIRFERLPEDQIASALQARMELEPDVAASIARMADGSLSRALDLSASEDLGESRAQVLAFVRGAFTVWSKPDHMAELIEQLSRRTREQLKFILELMLGWVRDLLLVRTFGTEAPIVNADQREALFNFIGAIPDAELQAMAEQIEGAAYLIDRNVNTRLVLTVLAQRMKAAMHGDADPKLLHPLTEVG